MFAKLIWHAMLSANLYTCVMFLLAHSTFMYAFYHPRSQGSCDHSKSRTMSLRSCPALASDTLAIRKQILVMCGTLYLRGPEKTAKDPKVVALDTQLSDLPQTSIERDRGDVSKNNASPSEQGTSNDQLSDSEWTTLVECKTEKGEMSEATLTSQGSIRRPFTWLFGQ
jgi:hypothetical protein